jgi:hypothetical protein
VLRRFVTTLAPVLGLAHGAQQMGAIATTTDWLLDGGDVVSARDLFLVECGRREALGEPPIAFETFCSILREAGVVIECGRPDHGPIGRLELIVRLSADIVRDEVLQI